jgi:hypothetical protein
VILATAYKAACRPDPRFDDDPLRWFVARRTWELWKAADDPDMTFKQFWLRFARSVALLGDDQGMRLLALRAARIACREAISMTRTFGPIRRMEGYNDRH